jgi:hypothetical protein
MSEPFIVSGGMGGGKDGAKMERMVVRFFQGSRTTMKDPERDDLTKATTKTGLGEASSVAEPAAAARWDDWYQTAGSGPFGYDDSPSAAVRSRLVSIPAEKATVPQAAAYLKAHLGPAVTAYLAGFVDAEALTRCAAGKVPPEDPAASRLILAYEATQLLVEVYGDETAQSWFVGMNPHLDENAPAYVLHHGKNADDWQFVVPAAREFLGNAF